MKKLKVSILYLLLTLICFVTGLFKEYLVFSSIIIFHELGHIVVSLLYKWKIKEINLNIYGGCIIFENIINKRFIEEFLVCIAGISFQFIYFLVMYILYNNSVVDIKLYTIFNNYNLSIIIFNMLPIYPLDGSKLINILLNRVVCFKKSHLISICVSILLIILFIVCSIKYNLGINFYLMSVLLIVKLVKEIKNHSYLFNNFLLERYLYKYKFKNKVISDYNVNKMYKYKNNIFSKNNRYIDEKDVLSNYFSKNKF